MSAATGPRPNILALLLSAVPGLGHWILGRARRGFFLFMAAAFGWNLIGLSFLTSSEPIHTWGRRIGIAIVVVCTVISIYETLRFGVLNRTRRAHRRRNEVFRRATTHYLKKEWREARQAMDEILDWDASDPAARLFLATLERRAGRPNLAVRHVQKALRANPASPFSPELEREEHLAREIRRRR